MSQSFANWRYPPKVQKESQSPEMKGRMNAARKVEEKKAFSALALSEKDHFEKMWKELEL